MPPRFKLDLYVSVCVGLNIIRNEIMFTGHFFTVNYVGLNILCLPWNNVPMLFFTVNCVHGHIVIMKYCLDYIHDIYLHVWNHVNAHLCHVCEKVSFKKMTIFYLKKVTCIERMYSISCKKSVLSQYLQNVNNASVLNLNWGFNRHDRGQPQ